MCVDIFVETLALFYFDNHFFLIVAAFPKGAITLGTLLCNLSCNFVVMQVVSKIAKCNILRQQLVSHFCCCRKCYRKYNLFYFSQRLRQQLLQRWAV